MLATDAAATSRTAMLQDGRTIGYAEFGKQDGPPVFVFHGNPGSRLDILYAGPEALDRLNARLIAPDRPGVGLSDYIRRRRVAGWPAAVNMLANVLGIDRYAVVGVSAGGPYAMACARFETARLTGAGVISSISPPEAPPETHPTGMAAAYFTLARRSPLLLRPQLWMMQRLLRHPARMIREAMKTLPGPDQAFLARPEMQEVFLASLAEGLRMPAGLAKDAALVARPWGFRPAEIAGPVLIWHGQADQNSPVAAARYLAQIIPQSTTRLLPDEGHLSMARYLIEMVTALTEFAGK